MTTRNFKNNGIFDDSKSRSEYNIPDDFVLPPCTVEDVDRALFELFDKQLPFTYKNKEGTKRAPVIFATGERFAILRRKKPLRDKSGALILPLVSIMRTGITQNPTIGAGTGQSVPMVVKKRLTEEDQNYQRILNKAGLRNSDDRAIRFHPAKSISSTGPHKQGFSPDNPENISNRLQSTATELNLSNPTLNPSIGNNIFEIISMPPPKYYTATYDVTFWTQYTSQMNDMLMSIMSLYQSYSQRTFKIETPKGYWFVAYAGESLNSGNNFDNFVDDERLVRYSFEVTVPAYIVGNVVPGGQSVLRRTFSAPSIEFGIETVSSDLNKSVPAGVASGNPADYILENIRTLDDPIPGQSIVSDSNADVDQRGPNSDTSSETEIVGNKQSKS